MAWLAAAGLVAAIGVAAGIVYATTGAIQLFRASLRLRRGAAAATSQILAATAGLEPRLEAASAKAARLHEAQVRLDGTLAYAAVLRAAFGEARGAARRIRGAVPRK
jgi:hypothetical protein